MRKNSQFIPIFEIGLVGLAYLRLSTGISTCDTVWENLRKTAYDMLISYFQLIFTGSP